MRTHSLRTLFCFGFLASACSADGAEAETTDPLAPPKRMRRRPASPMYDKAPWAHPERFVPGEWLDDVDETQRTAFIEGWFEPDAGLDFVALNFSGRSQDDITDMNYLLDSFDGLQEIPEPWREKIAGADVTLSQLDFLEADNNPMGPALATLRSMLSISWVPGTGPSVSLTAPFITDGQLDVAGLLRAQLAGSNSVISKELSGLLKHIGPGGSQVGLILQATGAADVISAAVNWFLETWFGELFAEDPYPPFHYLRWNDTAYTVIDNPEETDLYILSGHHQVISLTLHDRFKTLFDPELRSANGNGISLGTQYSEIVIDAANPSTKLGVNYKWWVVPLRFNVVTRPESVRSEYFDSGEIKVRWEILDTTMLEVIYYDVTNKNLVTIYRPILEDEIPTNATGWRDYLKSHHPFSDGHGGWHYN